MLDLFYLNEVVHDLDEGRASAGRPPGRPTVDLPQTQSPQTLLPACADDSAPG